MQNKFNIERVLNQFQKIVSEMQSSEDVVFTQFCHILDEFCLVFKQLNSFLGMAFSDVKDKVRIIKTNNELFPSHKGFFSFIKMEMDKSIHKYNGDNNSKLKAPPQFKKYNSTSRNLLRMMWLFTFMRVTFQLSHNPKNSMSQIFSKAYDSAFGEKHAWIVRKGAKLAIKASSDRKVFVEVITGEKYCQEKFQKVRQSLLKHLVPIHQNLWQFYKTHKLVDLD